MIPLMALFDDHQLYHSAFQIDWMITGRAGGTLYGCYKQSLRELWKRFRGLKELYAQRELLFVEIDELTAPKHTERQRTRQAPIQLKLKHLSGFEIDKCIRDTEREFVQFYRQASTIKAILGSIPPQRRQQLDEEMWAHRAKSAAAVDILTMGRLSAQTIELIQACPKAMRSDLVDYALVPERHHELIDWFLNHEVKLPTSEKPLPVDVASLIDSCELLPLPAL